MLKIVKNKGYINVYNTQTKKLVNVSFSGDYSKYYGNKFLDQIDEPLSADERLGEDIQILQQGGNNKVIAVITYNGKKNMFFNINSVLANPNNNVCLFNANGEFMLELQSYINETPSPISLDEEVLSSMFKVALGADSLTVKQTLKTLKNGETITEQKYLNLPYIQEKELTK